MDDTGDLQSVVDGQRPDIAIQLPPLVAVEALLDGLQFALDAVGRLVQVRRRAGARQRGLDRSDLRQGGVDAGTCRHHLAAQVVEAADAVRREAGAGEGLAVERHRAHALRQPAHSDRTFRFLGAQHGGLAADHAVVQVDLREQT